MNALLRARAPRRWINPTPGELLWSGHLYDYSGYAKANREVMFRLAKKVNIATTYDDLSKDQRIVDVLTRIKLDKLAKKEISKQAALLRFYVPLLERGDRYKICYTMMETELVHPDFIHRMNNYYNEVWTPTEWNKGTFQKSGLTVPCHVVPLGVNKDIYSPGNPKLLPPCELISTDKRNKVEVPDSTRDFLFLTVCQPTFRKGLVVLLRAWERAFRHDPTAKLLLGATAHSFGGGLRHLVATTCKKSKVYLMKGAFSEQKMADIYRTIHCYVSTSLGEGWNLPATEAAACGVPCILPRHSSHLQFANDDNAYLIDPDEVGPISGSGTVCFWYQGMPFSLFHEKAEKQLAEHLQSVRNDYSQAVDKAEKLCNVIRSKYTWDQSVETAMTCLNNIWKAK